MVDQATTDVVILGGGLAGLTLAVQLKNARPETDVVILDKRQGLAPEAAFKVGESTVPAGAHYFAQMVGMREHLEKFHLKKNGLRFFQPAGGNQDITRRIELGPREFPAHDNYQIDRGRFENELTRMALDAGADLRQGASITDIELREGDQDHTVTYTQGGEERTLTARWLVDAAGRAHFVKRKLGLSREVAHTINASWFRLTGGIDLEEWGKDDPGWMERMNRPGIRRFSTNHLMGEGYWVWLIPLGSDHISVGVCADPRVHPYEEIQTFEKVQEWLRANEPQLAEVVDGRTGDVADFISLKDFAFGTERVYSPDRWMLVGEAGAFADAFYSPGSDMIGYGNSVTTDLVTRDFAGEDITERLEFYNELHLRTFQFVLSKVEDHYPAFGNPAVMVPKLCWDAMLNHVGVVLTFVKDRFLDYAFMQRVRGDLEKLFTLNDRVQQVFRDWNDLEKVVTDGPAAAYVPAKAIKDSHATLVVDYTDDELAAEIARNVTIAEALAVAVLHRAARKLDSTLDPEVPVNPYAVGLRPDDWQGDGLYSGQVLLTLAEAEKISEGSQGLFVDPLLEGAA
ncbi:flavin-dependent dehydrogenase [Streptomyces sp. SAI-117]|uniref:NAD(P)/FAD-dependent oxidoreductase n=1 Tax=Streptomyces sp. SAI-117 TaxID=2940546 RepID=UPI002476D736|nr:tryptophan 7-halogenase [Streptomyces sp. SAI-117]MDH6570763.1 flavin-dependent dehydrogenase [Streptomyces sp. SAI-117]